ncbi:hypothetical protein ACFSKM_18575 [Ancylobacter dichloromethanicus]|nr:hypothetical protein [Ancylobacter dichloromethanicus]
MSLLGAAITWWFRIETTGVSLDDIGKHGHQSAKARIPNGAIAEL